jgi:hypothetical protein
MSVFQRLAGLDTAEVRDNDGDRTTIVQSLDPEFAAADPTPYVQDLDIVAVEWHRWFHPDTYRALGERLIATTASGEQVVLQELVLAEESVLSSDAFPDEF